MTDTSGAPAQPASALEEILPTAIEVVTDPRGFFERMAREGGYERPAIFAAVMLVVYGAALGVFSLLHLHFGAFLAALIATPIFGAIALLIGSAILFFLSRSLGGEASFESSFRVVAYCSALAPLQAAASLVPYLPLLVQAYAIYVTILAVIAVHKVPEQKAWTVLGGIGAVLLLLAFWGTVTARRVAPKLDELNRQMQRSTEELGKAMERMGQEMQQQQQGDEEQGE
ncbi:MAG: YIP1 family protein [Deltaproteobacteria bacterium]|nr:YIP1 family protein [Deltaproteobacteria bacterium]